MIESSTSSRVASSRDDGLLWRSVRVPVWLITVAVVGLLGYHAGAGSGMFAAPSAVATVDLNRVLEGLDKHAAMEAKLAAVVREIQGEHTRREEELKNLREQLDTLNDPAQRRQLEEEIARKLLGYDIKLKYDADVLDVERALLFKELYLAITKAIDQMAVAEGYDIVLVDDSTSEVGWSQQAVQSGASRELQVQQQIAARRMLYRGTSVDVTDALIQRMNNEFRVGALGAGGGGGGAQGNRRNGR